MALTKITNLITKAGTAIANIGYTPVNKAGDTMTGPLVVQSTIQHSGMTPAYTVNVTGTYSANTWYSVFTSTPGLKTIQTTGGTTITIPGIYIAQFYAETHGVGGGFYGWNASSVPFYFAATTGTNSGNAFTLPALYGSGHADNNSVIQLRIRQTSGSTDGGSYIDWLSTSTLTGLDNSSSGKIVRFYLYRIA